MSIDNEWANFISNTNNDDDDDDDDFDEKEEVFSNNICYEYNNSDTPPKASDIYISTKSKIIFLNSSIDLKTVFWNIPVISYSLPVNGVVKKQMKFNSNIPEEVEEIQQFVSSELYVDQQIMTSINNPNGRIKYKDIRKISIGISKKDIMSYRCKKKSAFYNCFVMILRIRIKGLFKEFHIKVFNTGKLEIPGIQNDDIFLEVLNNIISTLQPLIPEPINYNQKSDTVLINSNFNCGFFINREILYDILKYKYNIQCIYDPCSYPGIQSKFYYNPKLENQTGCQISDKNITDKKDIVEVSFMIFRTGSILIVGMCEEYVLYSIYEFLKNLLRIEFLQINQKINSSHESTMVKDKKKKIRRKNIIVTTLSPSDIGNGVL